MKIIGVVLGLALFVSLGDRAVAADRNKCGCYKDGAGTCFCDKKAKCGCPGDCEPKGCEEARNKELQKEIEAETKKAEASQQHRHGGSGDEESAPKEESSSVKAAGSHKMSAAQTKQLAKLIDLYLSEHPDARGKSIEEVRGDVSGH